MIDLILNYWYYILIFILFVTGIIFFIVNQRKNIKEWLLFAVIKAEKELGSKTGKIKLRQVYDEFIKTFPVISKLISFEAFSKLVDLALIEMKKLLETNISCENYVKGFSLEEKLSQSD